MNGRTENRIKAEKKFQEILSQLPRCLTDYYSYLVANGKEYTTCIKYCKIAGDFIETLPDRDLTKITLSSIVNYINGYEGKSDAHRALIWYALNSFFKYLVAAGEIQLNYLETIQRPKIKDEVKHVYMTAEELEQVIENVKQGGGAYGRGRRKNWLKRDAAIIYLLMVTGMRVSALVELNINSYDQDSGVIRTIDKGRKTFEYPLDKASKKYVDTWIEDREIKLDGAPTDALFISNRRTRMTTNSIRNLVSKYTEFLPKHITPHKFRASYGTNLYLSTKDPIFVQRSMGHANIQTTEIYLEGLTHNNGEAVRIMSDIFK